MTNQIIYTVGGTVQAGGGIYIPRKADNELLGYCRASEFAFILSSRQVGKSSLMVRTARELEQENIRSVIIDLSSIGVKISADEWYLGILNEIANTLELKTDIFTWWLERIGLAPAQRMAIFFRDVLLKDVSEPVVLFFDEIDSTLSIPFADDFFAALRAIYNARSTVEDFKRLSFVMIGVATPGQLIADSKRTPFNIGHRVELTDFTPEEALSLAGELGAKTLGWVFAWTGGHPYLTQRLCEYLSKSTVKLTKESVADAVKSLFEGDHGWQDNNLQFVRDMLTKRSPNQSRVLKTYKDIRMGKKMIDDERSVAKAHLKISGVVRSENGFLQPRNQIYKNIFSVNWAQENIPKNWTKIALVAFGSLSFILLFIFMYDFAVGAMSSQYAGDFYTSHAGSEKLKSLAGLFKLEGVLQNTDYDFRARELFYSLNWDEQTSLFINHNVAQEDKNKYLPVIINGLYVTMANVDGQRSSSDLLSIMMTSLRDVKTSESMNLQNEISLWLEARNASTNQDSLDKYNEAIQLNNNNPSTLYERALLELRLGLYEQALIDFDTTMRLAQNLSSEASEKEIITPTPRVTKTQSPQINSFGVETLYVITQIPKPQVTFVPPTDLVEMITPSVFIGQTITSNTQTAITVIPTAAVVMPTVQPDYAVHESYKSSFYSIAFIRSAIDVALQSYNENASFLNAVERKISILTNLKNAGLIRSIPADIVALSPVAIIVQTDISMQTLIAPLPSLSWEDNCINSTVWKSYLAGETISGQSQCYQLSEWGITAERGKLIFASNHYSQTAAYEYGILTPWQNWTEVDFTVEAERQENSEIWFGFFEGDTPNSTGIIFVIQPGDEIDVRAMPNETKIVDNVDLKYAGGVFHPRIIFAGGKIAVWVDGQGIISNWPVNFTIRNMFVGYRALPGMNLNAAVSDLKFTP